MSRRRPFERDVESRAPRAELTRLPKESSVPMQAPREFATSVMRRVRQEQRASALRRFLERTFENIVFPLYLAAVCSFFFWMLLGVSMHVLAAQLLQNNLGILVFLVLVFTGVLSLVMGLPRNRPIVAVGTASLALAVLTMILRVQS